MKTNHRRVTDVEILILGSGGGWGDTIDRPAVFHSHASAPSLAHDLAPPLIFLLLLLQYILLLLLLRFQLLLFLLLIMLLFLLLLLI